MTFPEAMAFVRSVYPKAKLTRWYKGRYTFSEVQGAQFNGKSILAWCRVEKAWKRLAMIIKKDGRAKGFIHEKGA